MFECCSIMGKTVCCPECGKEIFNGWNLKKHRKAVHIVDVASESRDQLEVRNIMCRATNTTPNRDSSSDSTNTKVPPQSSNNSTYLHGMLDLNDVLTIKYAVRELLERHQEYDIPNLCEFVIRNYPDLSTDAVPYVVLSAVEAAAYVAQFHTIAETYAKSDNVNHRQTSVNATLSLKAWEFGPRQTNTLVKSKPTEHVGSIPTYIPKPINNQRTEPS